MNKSILIAVAAFIVAAAGGFFGGLKYQQSKPPAFLRQFNDGQRSGVAGQRFGGNGAGFRPVNGEIIGVDADSITVKLADDSSKIVLLTDQTAINKAEAVTSQDLTVGDKVAVFGQENSDGSLTAQNIQLKPVLRSDTGPAAE